MAPSDTNQRQPRQIGILTCPACTLRFEDATYRACVEALKSFVEWFDTIEEIQRKNLIEGQTLETASKNWETMPNPSPDVEIMRCALTQATQEAGQ